MKTRRTSLILALILCLGLAAPAFAAGNDFTIENGVLKRYTGSGGAVVIPSSVTEIGEYAFEDCTGVTSVVLPSSVTEIGANAFWGCTGLTTLTIPDSVTEIGSSAFQSCTGLTSVTIPSSATKIGMAAFQDCTSLTHVTLSDRLTEIGGMAFAFTPWQKNQGEFAAVNGILLAYQGNGGAVTIPSSVTKIGDSAFLRCIGLTSVMIPDSVTEIGAHSFQDCVDLTNVTIPDSVTKIGDGAFYFCNDLADVYYGGSKRQWNAVRIGADNEALTRAALHCDSASASLAYASTQNVLVDGKTVEFQCYALKDANGNDTNYIKLRDVAQVLNGTAAQFAVTWDGAVNIVTGRSYTPNGTEMSTPFSGNRSYSVPTAQTKINGRTAALDAIVLTDDAGNGYTYYKLRDLGSALGFTVNWSADKGIFIETT